MLLKLTIFIILLLITHFRKVEFTVIKSIFHVSCKHAVLVHNIIMLCKKSNNKYPCEFLFTCIIKLNREVLLRLHNLKIWEKPIISSNPELKLILCSNKFKVGILPGPRTFVINGQTFGDTMLKHSKHEQGLFEPRG
jgi:hypothetical protein